MHTDPVRGNGHIAQLLRVLLPAPQAHKPVWVCDGPCIGRVTPPPLGSMCTAHTKLLNRSSHLYLPIHGTVTGSPAYSGHDSLWFMDYCHHLCCRRYCALGSCQDLCYRYWTVSDLPRVPMVATPLLARLHGHRAQPHVAARREGVPS